MDPLSDLEDDDLAVAFEARRTGALLSAYIRYGSALYGVACELLGAPAAEECVHDALILAWSKPPRLEGGRRSLRAFLIVCVRNEARRRRGGAERYAARPTSFLKCSNVSVRTAMARLSEEHRVALEQVYLNLQTPLQIAAELAAPVGEIRTRVARALRFLSEALASGTTDAA